MGERTSVPSQRAPSHFPRSTTPTTGGVPFEPLRPSLSPGPRTEGIDLASPQRTAYPCGPHVNVRPRTFGGAWVRVSYDGPLLWRGRRQGRSGKVRNVFLYPHRGHPKGVTGWDYRRRPRRDRSRREGSVRRTLLVGWGVSTGGPVRTKVRTERDGTEQSTWNTRDTRGVRCLLPAEGVFPLPRTDSSVSLSPISVRYLSVPTGRP